jgi:hypothetical protein
MLQRLSREHALLAVSWGASPEVDVPWASPTRQLDLTRFAEGCDAVIDIGGRGQPEFFDAAIQDAGLQRWVRVSPFNQPHPPVCANNAVHLIPGVLLGPGDPWGQGQILRHWAMSDRVAPTEAPALVDFRDVMGAIESALYRGTPGTPYRLLNDCPDWAALRAHLRGQIIDTKAREPPSQTKLSKRDIGWWFRDWRRTLNDTFDTA